MKSISGFSKLSKRRKIKWVVENFFKDPEMVAKELMGFWHKDEEQQKVLDGFSENTLSNFVLPFGVAPNFIINGKTYCVPMVIEESSVVAAAASAAKFWSKRGGIQAKVLGTEKIGQVHFSWLGNSEILKGKFDQLKTYLETETSALTENMRKRGGGILDIELLDLTAEEPDYYQLKTTFETCESMGANFINSVLEEFGRALNRFLSMQEDLVKESQSATIIMAILSNYTPECLVKASVSCKVEELGEVGGLKADVFAEKFRKAVRIAQIDSYRATTHNKGIYNGIDAVVLATANDFRAIEACGHTHAARDGQYRSLSSCTIENGVFKFWLEIPLAVGTVGGLTKLHPIAKRSLELLGNPTAEELMQVIVATGLAQNFAALRSLVTTGIQSGHMKMHLLNILNHLKADDVQMKAAVEHFADKVVSFSSVRDFLANVQQ